jgi:hypothetical protein
MRRMYRHHLIAIAVLLVPSLLPAQHAASPITHSLYVALGGDPVVLGADHGASHAVSAGVERARVDSRWSLRLGAEYNRVTSEFSESRSEKLGVALSARYGRRSGMFRPYLLGGMGIADLRRRGKWIKYDDVAGPVFTPVDSGFTSTSNWNGLITSGFGTDVALGRLRLFTEAIVNVYPARLGERGRYRGTQASKALYFGIRL